MENWNELFVHPPDFHGSFFFETIPLAYNGMKIYRI